MSETHARTVAYVAPRAFAAEPPPRSTTGAVGWLRENLFSGWLNALLTVLSIAFLVWLIPDLFEWAILKSVWTAGSLNECREMVAAAHGEGERGACWAVIRDRFSQFIYGFYPADLRWRVNVAFVGLLIAMIPALFQTLRPMLYVAAGGLLLTLLVAILGGGWSAIWSPTTLVLLAAGAAAVLFDTEAGRRRALILTALYPVIAYFLLWGGLGLRPVSSTDFGGFMLTLVIGVTGIAASLPIGILLALGRQSDMLIVRAICVGFIEFIRGVPLITLLFVASTLLNYFLPPGTNFDLILRVLIMVSLFASAYMAEVIRGGLAALPKGQYEAADALGLTYWQSMRLAILPQALKISIPGIVNTFIGLFKDTTLVSIIGLLDPLGILAPIRATPEWNGIVWELYAFVALLFFICCYGMSRYSMHLERRLRAGDVR